MSENGLDIELELRWLNDERYCCAESGCFLGVFDRSWWGRLRTAVTEISEREPPPLSVRVHGVVEEGACFLNLEQLGLPARSPAQVYASTIDRECDAK